MSKISLTIISDMHGAYEELNLPSGDLLIIAGDCTGSDKSIQWIHFFDWFKKQKYDKKILVAGNHDNFLFNSFPKSKSEADDLKEVRNFLLDLGETEEWDFDYLCDSSIEYEFNYLKLAEGMDCTYAFNLKRKIKIHGTPHSLTFPKINPHCTAFTGTEEELQRKYDLIPDDVNILISHSPPYGILDETKRGEHVGSVSLRNKVLSLPNLSNCFFGHIHEMGGKMFDSSSAKFYNCSIMNEEYEPVNKPTHIEIEL